MHNEYYSNDVHDLTDNFSNYMKYLIVVSEKVYIYACLRLVVFRFQLYYDDERGMEECDDDDSGMENAKMLCSYWLCMIGELVID